MALPSPKLQRQGYTLPTELLSSIADGLSLIDLLSFRGVCKDWRSASSTASAQVESTNKHPCLFLYGEGPKCVFFHQTLKKKYTINLPELEAATCLASNQGWLLLFQERSIFFFCPFSRAKIYLPGIPELQIEGHVAAFSAPPTSQECVVSVINQSEGVLELAVLSPGANEWTSYVYVPRHVIGEISSATYQYDEGCFYYCSKDWIVTFSLKDKEFTPFRLVTGTGEGIEPLPFLSKMNYYKGCEIKKWVEEEGVGVPVSTCGTKVPRKHRDLLIYNQSIIQSSSNNNCNSNDNDNGSGDPILKGYGFSHGSFKFLQIKVGPFEGVWNLDSISFSVLFFSKLSLFLYIGIVILHF